MDNFFIGTNDEILLEAGEVHSRAVVADCNLSGRDLDPHLRGVGVVGVVDKLTEKVDAFRVEAFADRDDVPLVNSYFEPFFLFNFHMHTAPLLHPESFASL